MTTQSPSGKLRNLLGDYMHLEEAKLGIVRVGAGRGFVIERRGQGLVITAAHCLPKLPPAMSFSFLEKRTYAKLLGDINAPPTIAAECLFVDPVADIAVLGEPDNQALPEAAEAYGILTGRVPDIPISDRIHDSALLLYVDGLWRPWHSEMHFELTPRQISKAAFRARRY
jgi:hypothetical protein